MKYAAEMGSVAMTYIPSFIKIGQGIQRHTDCTVISSVDVYFLKVKERKQAQ
jgi:hypothetical protein